MINMIYTCIYFLLYLCLIISTFSIFIITYGIFIYNDERKQWIKKVKNYNTKRKNSEENYEYEYEKEIINKV